MAKETGFDVKVQPIEFATGLEQGAAGKFDAMLTGWSGRIDPDGDLTGLVTTGGKNNYAGMSDPGIDDPIKQAAATSRLGAARAAVRQGDPAGRRAARDDLPVPQPVLPGHAQGRRRDPATTPTGSRGSATAGYSPVARWLWFILRRRGAAAIVLFLGSVLVFLGVRALPGDPARVLAGEEADAAGDRGHPARVRPRQAAARAVRASGPARRCTGDFGRSTQDRLPVGAHPRRAAAGHASSCPLLAMLVAIGVGVTAGIVAAIRRGRFADYVATGFGLVGLSVPHFWLGILGILLFSVQLHWLPASGLRPVHRAIRAGNLRAHAAARAGARHRVRGRADAADPVGDARLAVGRLRAHRPVQGPAGDARSSACTPCATA